jgi:hypothetical protein
MQLKFQTDVPGEQPNITAGGRATMQFPLGPRIGVIYVEVQVTKSAGGSGVTSLPLLTDAIDPTQPILVKINGREQRSRLATELIRDNLFQDKNAGGSVSYYQAGAFVARVNNASNASSTNLGLATNTATTAFFQVAIYFAEYWRTDLPTRENLMWPTSFTDGSFLPPLTVEVPIANNGGGAFSAWGCKLWFDYDGIQGGAKSGTPLIVKKSRTTKEYSVAGDITVPISQRDLLQQFSLILAAGDTWSKYVIKKNGTQIKQLTNDRLFQSLQDHGMNTAVFAPNIIDVVFDLNDDINAALPLVQNDTFEVIVTLASVAGSAQMVILTETVGTPN